MKISLNWIFDHIVGDKNKISIDTLVDRFIKTTAEIEGWRRVTLPVEKLTLVQIISIANNCVIVQSPELHKEFTLPFRTDCVVGLWYIVEYDSAIATWAKINSIGGNKDTLLPAVEVAENLRAGGWKKVVEVEDYILDVDNK